MVNLAELSEFTTTFAEAIMNPERLAIGLSLFRSLEEFTVRMYSKHCQEKSVNGAK
jgi:hypothetical protein